MTDYQIRCFLESAETLSFTAAAERLHFLPQTVSKNVRALETEMGATFFRRGRNSLELTGAGVYYAAHFRKLQHEYLEAVYNLRQQHQRQRYILTVAISERLQFSGELLRAIQVYQMRQPSVRLSVLIGNTTNSLQLNEADVGMIYTRGPIDKVRYYTENIAEEQEMLFVSDGVRGLDESGIYDRNCRGACLIEDYPSFNTSIDAMETLRQRLAQLDLHPAEIVLLPDPGSVIDTFHVSSVVAVAGKRFSLLAQEPGLQTFELPPPPYRLHLACVWDKTNDNPLIPDFVQCMKECLNC